MKGFDWKFWGWRKRVARLEEEVLTVAGNCNRLNEERIAALAREAEAEAEKEELEERLAAVYQRTPAVVTEAGKKKKDLERLLTLAGIADSNALWQVVLSYADEHERTEREVALRPGLGDGDRQYNAGRAGSAYDFATALRDLKVAAELEAKRSKRD